jgi:regulator of protease activity HflC (stomatin/prohibitin superfamily)
MTSKLIKTAIYLIMVALLISGISALFRSSVPSLGFLAGILASILVIRIFSKNRNSSALVLLPLIIACNRPEPNYEGVLMSDYGRNGIESFKVVTGAQGILLWGEELYQVPMWEQKGDPESMKITTKDGGVFTVDPSYTYRPLRGKGPNIVLDYKNYDVSDPDDFFDLIEANVLNKRVTDAYREQARNYTTDSLMNNLGGFESSVETILKKVFEEKHFQAETVTSGLEPPQSMAKAIEDRNKAIQEANKVKNELETSKMLLEKAKIDAETNMVNTRGLTKEVLTEKWIEAIKSTNNKVIITDGRTPIIIQ